MTIATNATSGYECQLLQQMSSGQLADGDAMQAFVHSHVTNMLHPFAEQIYELTQMFQKMEGRVDDVSRDVHAHHALLAEQGEQLSALAAAAAAREDRIETLQELQAASRIDKEALAGQQALLQTSLGTASDKLGGLAKEVDRLHRVQESTSSKVANLSTAFQNLNNRTCDVIEARVISLQSGFKDLQDKECELSKVLSQVQASGDATQETVHKLGYAFDQHRLEVLEKFSCRDAVAKGVEERLRVAKQDLHALMTSLKAVEKEIPYIHAQAGQMQLHTQQAHSQLCAISGSFKELTRRLGVTEEDIVQVRTETEERFNARDKIWSELDEKTLKHSSEIMSIQKSIQLQGVQLDSARQSIGQLESGAQATLVKTAALDSELRELSNGQKASVKQLDMGLNKVQQVCDGLQFAVQEETGPLPKRLDQLQGDLGDTKRALSKLDSRVDLMQNYFSGFSKGLQDAHRHIVEGDSTVLRNNDNSGTQLPLLQRPKSPLVQPPDFNSLKARSTPFPRKHKANAEGRWSPISAGLSPTLLEHQHGRE
eukprot:TRINITY_DN5958_c0_g1_i1.p1 TRINITY_DN5958_c0_g1~~TRINITY_DN5958_c0_g1_i1.p1  ORF type:complete len:541 (+),score=112.07 TRINITY_DN5958_c0_g1_i1:252-1874(+)